MNDFDFLHGSWDVANRRLTELLVGGDSWEEFPGHAVVRPLFGGSGNIDEITFPTLGHQGVTLRLFDQVRRDWSIHWADSRTGRLDPPVVGTFAGGRGDFYGEDTYRGRPVRVHFVWRRLTADSARWEQEFSVDGGQSWELNWVMEFSRAQSEDAS
ncbi:hypothetical protein ABCR94_04635 [Streptomyces sp. 21So2-11]|uniref:hypothetical protein n=1 Tax=Streptomyces sp. 21So2-11 TaxID=3144408 RepID=UPI00321A5BBE